MKKLNEKRKNKRVGFVYTICIVSIIALVLTGCEKKQRLTKYETQIFDLFDTVTTIIAYEETEQLFNEKVEKLQKELEKYHKLYDIYETYDGMNNLKTINDNAGIKPVKVDKTIIDLLEQSIDFYEQTNGKVNVAYGSVLSIWHDYRTKGMENPQNAKIPTKQELEEASKHTDIKKIKVDKKKSTVYLEEKEMSLDVGAVGKGYAVNCICKYAKELGMKNALINVGGNIYGIGTKGEKKEWKVGLQNPDLESKEAYVLKLKLKDKAFVTSGNYQRYYEVNGKRYHHIIDPVTKMPADYFASVSILSSDSGIADMLSTALYNMSLEQGKKLIEHMEDTEAVWIQKDGKIQYSSGFEKYILK